MRRGILWVGRRGVRVGPGLVGSRGGRIRCRMEKGLTSGWKEITQGRVIVLWQDVAVALGTRPEQYLRKFGFLSGWIGPKDQYVSRCCVLREPAILVTSCTLE